MVSSASSKEYRRSVSTGSTVYRGQGGWGGRHFPEPSGHWSDSRNDQGFSGPSNRKVLEAFLAHILQSDLPCKDYFAKYLCQLHRHNRRPNTLAVNFTAVKHFLRFIQKEGTSDLGEISRLIVEAFVEHEQDRGLKPATVYSHLSQTNAFLKFCIELGVVDEAVLKKRVRIKLPDYLPRAIEPEDVKRLLSVIDPVRDRAMILMLLRTGMRIGELLGLRISDLDLNDRRVLVYEAQKTRVGRVVYFSDDAARALSAWIEKRDRSKDRVFYGQGRESLGYARARMLLVKYVKLAELSGKGYTLHCLRHTFASELLNAGMRLECLQQLLGHTSLDVTRRYARLTDKTREDEYFRAMNLIERGGVDGHYRFDRELQKTSETEELLPLHGEGLHEHP
jgi:integrase/recombinase XerD